MIKLTTVSMLLCAGLLGCVESADAPGDEALEITDEMVAAEVERLAGLSGGQLQPGRVWAAVDGEGLDAAPVFDAELVRAKLAVDATYRQRVVELFGEEKPVPSVFAVIGVDNRTAVANPRTYPNSKHVYIIMQRPHTELTERRTSAYVCSGTLLDDDFVLTAAHCIYNRGDGHFAYANDPTDDMPAPVATQYGTDYGRGFACLGGDVDSAAEFEDNCEFIQARWVPGVWSGGTANETESDYALVKLQRANHPDGLGHGNWMAMSAIDSAGTYDDKTAVINGFPTTGPLGSNFVQQLVSITDPTISTAAWQTANWAFYTPATLFHRSGDIDNSTTQAQLAYTADSSGGDSGAAVFYYTDNATTYSGQGHYILGVHHGGLNGNGFNVGATVHEFRDWVTTTMAAN